MRLERARERDFEDVRQFYEAVIDGMAGSDYHPRWKKGIYPTDAFFRAAIQKGELHIVRLDGAVVGAMVLNHQSSEGYEGVKWALSAQEEQITVIHTLAVLPACHGRGIGRFLVGQAIQTAREGGQRAVRLDVLASNLPAQRLYAGMGFEYRETVRLFYENTGLTDFMLYEFVIQG